MLNDFFSTALAFFLVMDALGSIPTYLSLLENFERKKWRMVCLREVAISLVMMVIFFFVGEFFDFPSAQKTMRFPDASEEHAQIVVYLGNGRNR